MIFQIMMSLQEIHNQGYVFRDLKPSNILLTQNMYPKITDFGLVVPIGTVD